MNKEKIEKQLLDIDMEILSDMKQNLAEEMSKTADERDEKLISELEEMISQTGKEIISASKKRSFESVMKILDEYKEPERPKLYKWLSAAVACFLVVLGLNTVSMKTFGQNMFSAAYQLTKGGITISTNQSDDNGNIFSESDPYGMKAKCAEYGFFPDTPSYIPDGFVLKDISVESDDYSDSIIFAYTKENVILNFLFVNYKTNDEIPPIGIPTDTYNITEEQINGHTIHILKEDFQFTADFLDKRIQYGVFAENLDYDECQKILAYLT
ncbi:MAG: DUF4367 domain-containing protein [Ruminococcus sp.]|nr:DUF4367 domain-containing protein [Ruminococcus sp.]